LNSKINKQNHNRFAIVIWSKSVNSGVSRNFFRRLFYEEVRTYITKPIFNSFSDFVVLVKKETSLDKRDEKSIIDFKRDLNFVFSNAFKWEDKTSNIKFNFKK
jgi:RNase P protein component